MKIYELKTVKNAGWLISGKVAQLVISFAVSILTARYLGPSNYGLINYAATYTAFFTALSSLGINSVLVKEFIDHPHEEGTILGTTFLLRTLASFLSVALIVCISLIIDADEKVTIIVVALYNIGMIFKAAEAFNYWFQSKLESKITAIASLIAYVITSAYKAFLLASGAGVISFALVTSLEYLFLGVLSLIAYKREKSGKFKASAAYARSLLRKSYPFIISGTLVAIYGQSDKLFVKQMLDNAEAGYYSLAASLSAMWCFVLQAIIDSAYPSIVEAYRADNGSFVRRNKILYCIVFYLSTVVSVFFMLFAKPIISVLYGPEYIPATSLLVVVTWSTVFSYLGVARNAWIVCNERQKSLVFIYAVAVVVNISLNLIMIPRLGAMGAAIVAVFTQLCTSILIPLFFKSFRENAIMMLEAIAFKGVIK